LLFPNAGTGVGSRPAGRQPEEAYLISIFVLASLNIWLTGQLWYQSSVFFQIFSAVIPMVIIMPAGPLLYFYSRSILDPGFVFTKNNWRNFSPIIIDFFPHIIAIFYLIGLALGIIKNNPGPVFGFIDKYNVYADLPRWLSFSIYLLATLRLIHSHMNKVESAAALKWLRQLGTAFVIFQAVWLIYLIPYLLPDLNGKLLDLLNWYPVYVPLSVLIYWIGIKGYLVQQHLLIIKKTVKSLLLSSATIEETIAALNKAMLCDMLYLNPELNLNIVARHIEVSPKIISAVLNQQLHQSFNDFVNRYRIEAFKSNFISQQHDHLTIVGIAFECGFNSPSTFQRAFKQFTGISPKEFRRAASLVKA
jgi:AraC-like DNA-binding protein